MRLPWLGLLVLGGVAILSSVGCGVQAVKTDDPPPTSKSTSTGATSSDSVAKNLQAEATPPPAASAKSAPTAEATALAAASALAVDEAIRQPATVAEAAKVLDLATFPLMPGAKDPGRRVTASLSYEAAGDVKSVFEFQKRTLQGRNCKELSPPQIYDQSASGEFGRDGYFISVSVIGGGKAEQVSVYLQNHSNVNLRKLPVPPGTKLQYAFPAVASFETAVSVDKTAAAVRKLLVDQGWQPYGSAGDVTSFKQNAVQLDARVLAPPAQPGKTVIDYSARQMSADLPAPADAEEVQYADQLKQLNMNALGTPDEVAAHYQAALASGGWKSTTEKPVKDGVESFLIFRNPEKELLQLDMWDMREEMKTRVTLRHQSAAEVEELDRQAKLAIAEKKKQDEAERNKPKPKAIVMLPAEAQDVQAGKTEIEFHLATGQGKAAVDAIIKQLVAAGWKSESPVGDNMAGQISLTKDGHSVKILYVDPGFIPAQITISGWGVELERAGATK
jgi:hypothetical protein